MASGLHLLGPMADKVVPIFVTIDPERDTPQAMGEYVKLFDDRLVGLTGTAQEIADIAREYRVYYAKVESKAASSYLMDHSSFMYLMGPDGRLQMLIKPGSTGQEIANDIRSRLAAS
jgi:protein SCO1/2